jgi:hypothetical protein
MDQDLKKENNRSLFLIMAASLACSILIQVNISSITRLGDLAALGGGGLMLSVVLVMLANLVPHDIKHKLVFLRIKNEMPACRVHELCRKEPRVEHEELKSRWPDIFGNDIDAATRNSRWYQKIYKTVKDREEVRQAHRNFLLYRDAFSGLLAILLIALAGFVAGELPIIGQLKIAVIYVQSAFAVLALIAANIAGKRLVVNAVVVA